ncbi:MAG: NCS2 family permease [Myxococcales bacterium]|nr:NCS2 family permease [Myxococcales bacterium]
MRTFARGDIDGFFGLFVDNLLQLMLAVVLSGSVCGQPASLIVGRVLPGAAASILLGNLFYAWQAKRTGDPQATALPFGINTPSLLAYLFLIMGPVYRETGDALLAWRLGCFACLASGILELLGAFVGDWLRRYTPRAALLGALAGVAVTFISMGFVFQIFAEPWVALFPALLLLVAYTARVRLPGGLPAGLVAVVVGTLLAWTLPGARPASLAPSNEPLMLGFHPPWPVIGDVVSTFTDPRAYRYFSVILPMGLFNVVGSLQNLESAEAAGDRYPTRPSLLANGIATVIAAFLGSPFPTTIYIGHPGWKAMGAGHRYSVYNGIAVTALCLFGAVPLVLRFVPVEATLGILLYIGVVITAQAFQEVPREHAPAVVVSLLPGLAAWVLVIVDDSVRAAGSTLYASAAKFGTSLYLPGVIALSQGFLLTSMVLAAIVVFVLERRFLRAAAWALAAAALSMVGLIHAYDLTADGVMNRFGIAAAPAFGVTYALTAVYLAGLHLLRSRATTPAP